MSPTSATLQLPADSAGARLLGLPGLQPETSTSYSVGIVAHPLQDLSITVDGYAIAIGNRITSSSTVTSAGGAINTPLVSSAIAQAGVSLDPIATQQGVTAFLNGLSSVTEGVDLTVSYPTDLGDYGSMNWTLAGNTNFTHVHSVAPPPAVLVASNPNAFFFNYFSVFAFEHSTPNIKLGLTADWSLDEWGATVRESYYGPQHSYVSPNAGGEQIPFNQAGVGLTDLEARYSITDQLQFALGANNLFNIHPRYYGAAPPCNALPTGTQFIPGGTCRGGPNTAAGGIQTISNGSVFQNPFGTAWDPNGGYYYGRITFNF